MIAIIRIRGKVEINRDIEETLSRLRLRRKYACVIIKGESGMLYKVENFVAYGKIDKETLKELIEKRGKSLSGKKINADKIAKEFSETEKKLSELGIKDFFRLHPPRGGIKSKIHYPKGVLGNHGDKINDLIRRML